MGSRWGAAGRGPLTVLCLVGLVDALDRGVLPGVLPKVQRALGFGDFQAGLLDTALIVATLLLAVPGGLLADRVDRRRLIRGTLGVWALSSALAAATTSFGQLFAVRAVLGAGDALNDPAAQSLVAEYYPPEVRGRAFGWQRVVPTVGRGLGLGLGALVGALLGWRAAFLLVGVPGILVALLVRRLPAGSRAAAPGPARTSAGAMRATLSIPSLRALLLTTAVTSAALSALAFWGVAYHVRSSGLAEGKAGAVAGGVILLGAVTGGFAGGVAADRLRQVVADAGMLLAAGALAVGTLLLLVSFVDGLPVYAVRLPLQGVAVAFLVAALPALAALTTEVVPGELRGTAFGILKFGGNLLSALAPPLVGLLADAHKVADRHGVVHGDLGFAFRWTVWTVLIGSVLLAWGRRHVASDMARAAGGGVDA